MRDQAIYNTHPHVKTILDGTICLDADGSPVSINEALVTTEQDKLLLAKSVQVSNREALAYLLSTDWMVIRQQESGTPMPLDITNARAAARIKIVRSA